MMDKSIPEPDDLTVAWLAAKAEDAATIAALRAEVKRLKAALTVPEVWSENERDGMAQAFKISDGKNGHYETLFAVAAWLLRHRSARAALGDAS